LKVEIFKNFIQSETFGEAMAWITIALIIAFGFLVWTFIKITIKGMKDHTNKVGESVDKLSSAQSTIAAAVQLLTVANQEHEREHARMNERFEKIVEDMDSNRKADRKIMAFIAKESKVKLPEL